MDGKHSTNDPGASFDQQWSESADAAASRPEPTLQEKVLESMEARRDLAQDK